jgi:adenine-specific DNA-methyltransferase
LAEISRAFNREFYYTPVVVVFKYDNYLAFANTERLKYKQEWREGEKAGKVSLLRDIHIEKPHSGHERILAELQIPNTGNKKVDSFAKLYAYWQEVFSVSLLNKKFYQELSNWYFWATQHVTFPGEPTIADAHHKNAKLEDLLQEHRATNVIRMLTRLLFVWFIKEKKLIPEELFELDALQKDILNEISPYHERGMFKERNKESIYYKAILQNLFFATLNCPIEGDSLDKRKRGFRGDGYGTHRGIDYLMRYKSYFKNPDAFLTKLNDVVPFLNGGLFECLDDKFNNLYIDGFSDQMTKGEQLIVPDYLFFGVEEETDLSDIVGISDKKYKQAAVKGLINILKSYKFTITENTPIEEDVALDPELLGKVFENLLASYNPETKTTARKQTGSFYTPREIVNYMVDESLIAYLKNAISDWGGLDDETLDKELHVLTSFDSKVPFADNSELQREIITALSTCTILDPACGSGAFPMGILQKMVHILQKLDPENKVWKEVQLAKAEQESKAAFEIEDKQAREERLIEINEAFDQSINDPDYARKLFLIENCIYGVDIQPIATQISKLRFFISLVVEQKVNSEKDNFGIRPLPNLETKFVAANTLIGIEKPSAQLSLYDTKEVKALETKLKKVRSKLFSAKSKETKLKYREEDKVLRNQIAEELEKSGWKSDTAQKLAGWDPYDQNASFSFL